MPILEIAHFLKTVEQSHFATSSTLQDARHEVKYSVANNQLSDNPRQPVSGSDRK